MKYIYILIILYFSFCTEENNQDKEISSLIEDEKFELAKDKIKSKLATKRQNDEIISIKKPVRERLLEISNDRNRVVWTEDKQIIFRDLANPFVKTTVFPQTPEVLSISSEGEYSLVAFPLPNQAGCRLVASSLIEVKPSYVSESYVSCKEKGGISSEGTIIYYFINGSLYSEVTKDPKKPRLIVPKEHFDTPATGIRNRGLVYPIGKTFIIFYGNAGHYFIYWFDPKSNTSEKLGEAASPKLFYGNGKNAYIVSGQVGALIMKELKYTAYGKPTISKGFPINSTDSNSWPTSKQDDFFTLQDGELLRWTASGKRKLLPVFCERFWGVARDFIIYENKEKDLILASTEFGPEDWNLVEMYKKVRKKK